MTGLGALLLKTYPGADKQELAAVRVFGAWNRALSQRIVSNARPVKLWRGTLTVHTVTSAWANSLQLESESLLKALRARVTDVPLRKLMFRVGPMPAAPVFEEPPPEITVPAESLPDDIARELVRIQDDGLRAAIARAAAAGLGELMPRPRSLVKHDVVTYPGVRPDSRPGSPTGRGGARS